MTGCVMSSYNHAIMHCHEKGKRTPFYMAITRRHHTAFITKHNGYRYHHVIVTQSIIMITSLSSCHNDNTAFVTKHNGVDRQFNCVALHPS